MHHIYNNYRVLSATICGTTYKKEAVLVYAIEDDQPVFGKIEDLIVTPSQECFFVLSPLTALPSRHFHSFEVTATSQGSKFVCKHCSIVDHYPLHLSRQFGPNGKLTICLKYHVVNKMWHRSCCVVIISFLKLSLSQKINYHWSTILTCIVHGILKVSSGCNWGRGAEEKLPPPPPWLGYGSDDHYKQLHYLVVKWKTVRITTWSGDSHRSFFAV